MSISSSRCSALGLCAVLGSAPAQPVPSSDAVGLERVIITGSNIPRVDAETALPVQIIRREDIERSGALTVEELMTRIPAIFNNVIEAMSIGTFNQPGFSGASLRGFGSHSTLVLINGRRVANYAFSDEFGTGVDLHAIPLAAIDRIEVLTDGASAIYGSDAVAGVINFILRRDFRGAQLGVERAFAEAGGGAHAQETLALGIGDMAADGFNVFAVIDHQRQEALASRERAFAATSYRPAVGIDRTSRSSFPANISVPEGFVNPAAPACTEFTVFKEGGCWYDPGRHVDLLPQTDNLGVLARGTLALPNNAEAYAELLWSRQRMRFSVAPTPVSFSGIIFGQPLVIPEGSPFYPSGLGISGDIVDPFYRTVPLGPRVTEIESDNWRALIGWHGAVGSWDVDAALTQSVSSVGNDAVAGFVDVLKLADAAATGQINLFGDSGPAGNALLASTELTGRTRSARGTTRSVDFRASRDVLKWSAGTMTLGLGGEARSEALDDHTTELAAVTAGGAFQSPKTGSRQAQALYAELVLPIVSKLDAQLAVRADHYSDFGTSNSPKVALRWQPTKALLLRASAGTGFRAPSLPELYAAQILTPPLEIDGEDPKRCPVTHLDQDCNPVARYFLGGNPALSPETSRQASFGLVFEPVEGGTVSVDWWRLRLDHTIGQLDDQTVLSGDDRYEGKNIVRGPVDPAFPDLPGPIIQLTEINENVGRQSASGIDLNLRYRSAAHAAGQFTLELNGSYLASFDVSFDGEHEEALAGRQSPYPRWQHALTLGWERGPWNATLTQIWRAGTPDQNPDENGEPLSVEPYRMWDAQLGYTGISDLTLVLGVKNLFDSDPPFSNQGSSAQVGYDPSYADPRGRVWYVRASYRWR